MDVLSDVLSVTRMGSTVVAQAELVPPWACDGVGAKVSIAAIMTSAMSDVNRGSAVVRCSPTTRGASPIRSGL